MAIRHGSVQIPGCTLHLIGRLISSIRVGISSQNIFHPALVSSYASVIPSMDDALFASLVECIKGGRSLRDQMWDILSSVHLSERNGLAPALR